MPVMLPGDPNTDPQMNGNGGSPPRERQSIVTQNTASPTTEPAAVGVVG
jgi:hypothetical protein